jgi:transcriptional regulator with XRE-family HTH domain
MRKPQPDHVKIRDLREARGWPQQQLADVARVNLRTIQRVETGQGASHDTLCGIASAFDMETSDLLVSPTPTSPPRLPKLHTLHRVRSGEDLCTVVGAAHMFHIDYDHPSDSREVNMIGSFLQEAQDIADMWDQAEPSHRVQWGFSLGTPLRELEGAGFRVFASRVTRKFRWDETAASRFPAADTCPFPMDVAIVLVLRSDNPKILYPGTDREHTVAVFEQDVQHAAERLTV